MPRLVSGCDAGGEGMKIAARGSVGLEESLESTQVLVEASENLREDVEDVLATGSLSLSEPVDDACLWMTPLWTRSALDRPL